MTQLNETERQQLVNSALAAQQRAYAEYSHFPVGAAILHDSGLIFTGANVENGSFGLTLCAERVAACSAVTAAEVHSRAPHAEAALDKHRWRAIAVASRGGATPCGACRQFLMEFAPDMEVLLIDSETNHVTHLDALHQLLPAAFEFTPQPKEG